MGFNQGERAQDVSAPVVVAGQSSDPRCAKKVGRAGLETRSDVTHSLQIYCDNRYRGRSPRGMFLRTEPMERFFAPLGSFRTHLTEGISRWLMADGIDFSVSDQNEYD